MSKKKLNSKPKSNLTLHETVITALVEMAKARATRKHVPFALTYSDVQRLARTTACPITGLPFVYGVPRPGSRPHPLAPSIDRINPLRGYVRSNVRLTSWWANSARNTLSDEQFAVFVDAAWRTRQNAILS